MAKGKDVSLLAVPNAPLRESGDMVLVRLNEMLKWAALIDDPQRVEELHNMRIAAKRLRYTLEFFVPVYDARAQALLSLIEEVQERLGYIHDRDVLFPLLLKTLEKETRHERRAAKGGAGLPAVSAAEGLAALMTRTRTEREKAYEDFRVFWSALPPSSLVVRFARVVAGEDDPTL